MESIDIKKEARILVDHLPENADWDELIYEIYVRKSIESGLRDSENGNVDTVNETRKKFGLFQLKVFWTNHAVKQLSSIFNYISEDSSTYAKITIDKITHRSEQIKKFPYSGKIVQEYRNHNIREIVEGSYRIIYNIKNNQIDILSIIHVRRILPV